MSLSDVSAFLMSLRQEESLGRGTSLWTEVRSKMTEMNHPGPREAVNTTTHSGFGFCFVWEKKREEGMGVINIPVRKLMA